MQTATTTIHKATNYEGVTATIGNTEFLRGHLLKTAMKLNGKFIDNGDGTVTDKITGLMWQQAEGGVMDWNGAMAYPKRLALGGHSDWRLPSAAEMRSILDREAGGIYFTMNTTAFPEFRPDIHMDGYWTSHSHREDPEYALLLELYFGGGYWRHKKHYYYVRCVRSGK